MREGWKGRRLRYRGLGVWGGAKSGDGGGGWVFVVEGGGRGREGGLSVGSSAAWGVAVGGGERDALGEKVEVRWGAAHTWRARQADHTHGTARARDSVVVHAHRNGGALEGNVPRSVPDSWRLAIRHALPPGPVLRSRKGALSQLWPGLRTALRKGSSLCALVKSTS